jgi:hypothetical protein
VPERAEDASAPVDPRLAAAVVDVFVSVVVLNLFVEYLPHVLSETFTLSLLTAVLLKVVLDVRIERQPRRVLLGDGPHPRADAGAGGRAEAPPRLGPRRLDLNPTPGSTVRP